MCVCVCVCVFNELTKSVTIYLLVCVMPAILEFNNLYMV